MQQLTDQVGILIRQKQQALEYLAKYGDHLHECAKTYSEEEACTCGFASMVVDITGDDGI